MAQIQATSAEAPFELFNNKQGLSQAFVPDMLQDKEGLLWFATNDGLNCYDGYRVKVFRQSTHDRYALPDNSICQIEEDPQGRLWVGTVSKGIFIFDRTLERFYPVPIPPYQSNALGTLQFAQHYLLISNAYGLAVYDLRKLTQSNGSSLDSSSLQKAFALPLSDSSMISKYGTGWFLAQCMPDQSVWLAKKDSVFVFRPIKNSKQWSEEFFPASHFGMGGDEIFHLANIGSGDTIGFIGLSAISLYSSKKHQLIYTKPFGTEKISKEVFYPNPPAILRDGNMLFCTMKHWYHFNPKTRQFTALSSSNGIGQFSGISHMLDRDSVLWTGSSGRGLFKFNFKNTLFHSIKEDCYGLAENALQQVIIRFRSGPKVFDPETKMRSAFVPSALWKTDWIWEDLFCAHPQSDVWIRAASRSRFNADGVGNQLLLLRYDPRQQKVEEFSNLYNPTIYKNFYNLKLIFTGKDKRLWMLYQFDQEPYYRLNLYDEQSTPTLTEIPLPVTKTQHQGVYRFYDYYEDSKGNLWLGSNEGLFKLNIQTKQWTVYREQNKPGGLSGDKIISILPDPINPDIYLWIGTDGQGLNKFNQKTGHCETFRTEQGLANNTICAMQSDDYGNLWLSTNEGLTCFNIKNKTCRNYNTDDGFPGNEFNTRQTLKTTQNQLFFAGIDGIVWFNPKDIVSNLLPENNLVFTKFSIFNREINCKTDSLLLPQSIQVIKQIKLPHDQNMFTIEFALLQYCAAEKKQYRYWLEGFDKTWIENGSKNSVTYTNLDPGSYTLHVKGRNSDGIWNAEGKTLRIVIMAPWYATVWFRSMLIILLLGGLYAFYRYRLHESTKMIKMRNTIASDLHDEIGSTISSIVVYTDIIKEKEQDPDLLQIAHRVNDSSKNILTVMSDIVWSINPINDRFDNVILRMKSHAHEVLEAQHKTLFFEVDNHLNAVSLNMNDRKNFYLIFKEALNNILKYAEAKTVWIKLQLVKDHIEFYIKDDGLGFNLNDYKEGNGIVNMQVRSKALHGDIHFESILGEGTAIRLIFPVKF